MNEKYAPTSWGQEPTLDLTVPSGQMCQVRMPGVQELVSAGVFESVDTLTNLIDEKHIKRVQGRAPKNGAAKPQEPQVDTASLMKDPESLVKVFSMVDKVTEHMVLQPTVKRPVKKVDGEEKPLMDDEREEGVVYTDRIQVEDKMFIFQYAVGGSTDVEAFRERFKQGMGSLAVK